MLCLRDWMCSPVRARTCRLRGRTTECMLLLSVGGIRLNRGRRWQSRRRWTPVGSSTATRWSRHWGPRARTSGKLWRERPARHLVGVRGAVRLGRGLGAPGHRGAPARPAATQAAGPAAPVRLPVRPSARDRDGRGGHPAGRGAGRQGGGGRADAAAAIAGVRTTRLTGGGARGGSSGRARRGRGQAHLALAPWRVPVLRFDARGALELLLHLPAVGAAAPGGAPPG